MGAPRNKHEFNDQIDAMHSWRRKEIASFKSKGAVTSGDHILRAGVVIVYAHWEGFFKDSVGMYISYIQSQIKKGHCNFKSLSDELRYAIIWKDMQNLQLLDDPARFAMYFSQGKMESMNFKINTSNIVDTKSNLNFELAERLILVAGLPVSFLSSSQKFINETLLKKRNHIAHGRRESVDRQDFDKICEKVIEIISQLKDEIQNAVDKQQYVKTSI
jgi:hypothetical protein